MSLTAEGRQLADAAGSAMADMEGVLRSLRVARAEHDRVRITTLHSLAYTWLLPRMPDFVAAHPQLRLERGYRDRADPFRRGRP